MVYYIWVIIGVSNKPMAKKSVLRRSASYDVEQVPSMDLLFIHEETFEWVNRMFPFNSTHYDTVPNYKLNTANYLDVKVNLKM